MKVIYHRPLPIPEHNKYHVQCAIHYLKTHAIGKFKKADLERKYYLSKQDPTNKKAYWSVTPDIVLDDRFVVEIIAKWGSAGGTNSMFKEELNRFGLELLEVYVPLVGWDKVVFEQVPKEITKIEIEEKEFEI